MLPAYNTEEGETADWRQTAGGCENELEQLVAQEQEAEKVIKLLETNIYPSI